MPRYDGEWLRVRLDESLDAGYEYLYQSAAFRKSLANGGQHPLHHYMLEQALNLRPHRGLLAQLKEARDKNQMDPDCSVWFPLTGHGPVEKSGWDRTRYQAAVEQNPMYYGSWFIFAAYPNELRLPTVLVERLFDNVDLLEGSYDLAHAHMTYQFLQHRKSNGGLSEETVARAKECVNRRLWAMHERAITVGDAYIERLAIWSLDGGAIRQRWIERIVESQGSDGGWVIAPSYLRRIQGLLNVTQREETSGVHATFLAVVAISHYLDRLDGLDSSVDSDGVGVNP